MANSIFQIGVSGLNAAQYGLSTTSENISNASTPGYDTESAQTQEAAGQYTGSGFLGNGVDVTTVTRAYSQYLTTQLNAAVSQSGALSATSTQLNDVNNILGSPTAGLTTSIDNFFTSLQSVSTNPSSTSSRSAFLGTAQTLTTQINDVATQFDTINTNVNTQITSTVASINTYATQISTLNNQIEAASAGAAGNQPPNNLLDQRDAAIASLSQLIGTTVVPVAGGADNVFIGTGQSLVLGAQSYTLEAVNSPSNPNQSVVAYTGLGSGASSKPEYLQQSTLSGGTLGGLLAFRSQTLAPAQTALNTITSTIAGAVNTQNELGLNLTGQQGTALFSTALPTVVTNTGNTGTGVVSVAIANPANPPPDNYTLSYNGSQYSLTDQSTGATTSFAPTSTFPVTAFGLNINISGTVNAGDSFNIEPTAYAASTLALTTTNPANVAAAAPILAATGTNNLGTAAITQGTVNSDYFSPVVTSALSSNTGGATISKATESASYAGVPLAAPVSLTYTAGAPGTLSGFPAATSVVVTAGGVSTTYNTSVTTNIPAPSGGAQYSFDGVTVNLSGTPANGDGFVIAPNAPLKTPTTLTFNSSTNTISGFPTNDVVTASVTAANGQITTTNYAPPATAIPYNGASGVATTYTFGGASVTLTGPASNNDTFTVSPNDGISDGRNALALADLATAKLLGGGTQSITGAYGVLVSQIGSESQNTNVSSTAATALVTQFTTQQQSVSGVNLDEEAANLLQFQQVYQANSKVIQIASSLFNTILAIQ